MANANITTQEEKHESINETRNRIREIVPNVDIYKNAEHIYLEANVPGVDENSLDISVEENTLSIFGKNQNTQNPELENLKLRYAEFRSGNYRRSFQFQEPIDAEGIEATVKNGVLSIKIPLKKPEVRKITVKAE